MLDKKSKKGERMVNEDISPVVDKRDNKYYIDKARAKHKDKYDYSELVYTGMRNKLIIICPIHGRMNMTGYAHLSGLGCPLCSREMSKKSKTTTYEEFVRRSSEVYNGKYTYENAKDEYVNSKKRVHVTCPKHGDWLVIPAHHIVGKQGCRDCALEKNRGSLDTFLKNAAKAHGDRYGYELVNYVNSEQPVTIRCRLHGLFQQRPASHTYIDPDGHARGCYECGRLATIEGKTLTQEEFIRRVKVMHGNTYDLSKAKFTGVNNRVIVGCKAHGDISITASSLFQGCGCNACGYIRSFAKLTSTREEFISKADEIHEGRYLYDKVKYVTNKVPVTVTCKIHGDWNVRPDNHCSLKHGCPWCSASLGELKIRDFLIANNIEFIKEYVIPDSGTRYRYDLYLPKLNILIEYHGQQHYRANELWGGTIGYMKRLEHDKSKIVLARSFKYHLITIKYDKFEVLEDYLLFEISKIYRYRVADKFYKREKDVLNGLALPIGTDIKHYLTYIK